MDWVVGLPSSPTWIAKKEMAHSQAHRLEEIEHNQKHLLIIKLFNPRTMNPPSTNDGDKRSKAIWDLKATEFFVQICLDQVSKRERIGTSFTKKGWKCIVSEFNDLTGRKYDKAKLKNRYDSLRKDWRSWYNLFGKETGLGWDIEKNTVDAPDEWWDNKQLENPLYGKFRNKGLPFALQLTILFKDVAANGEFMFAPSCVESLPNDPNDDDDGYHPCLENIVLGTEEGSGDSEDASIEATNEFANIGTRSHKPKEWREEKEN